MTCKKCKQIIPDGTVDCPYCGMHRPERMPSDLRRLYLSMALATVSTFFVSVINFFLNVTAAHYSDVYELGILISKLWAYESIPALEAVDVAFYVVYLLTVAIAAVGYNDARISRRRGAILIALANALALLATVVYPLITYALSDMISPVLWITTVMAIIHTAVSVICTVYLFKSDFLIY